MLAIFKILKNELKLLRISVLIISIALLMFTASLFSILSVYVNLSSNIFNSLDNDDNSLVFDACNINFATITTYEKDGLFIADKNQLTRNAIIKNQVGNIFETEQKIQNENGLSLISYTGIACYPTKTFTQIIDKYKNIICLKGDMVCQKNEICISDFVATQLNVSINDIVYINNISFLITGIYTNKILDAQLPYYILSTDDNVIWDRVNIQLGSSKKTYQLYNKLNSKGKDVQIPSFHEIYINNFSLMNALLIASSIILFFVNIVMVYALFSMILLNRKSFICKLDILGYKRENVFAIYYGIISLISFVVNLFAIFIANFISENIVKLCADIFSIEMIMSSPWWIAIGNFLLILVVSLFLYLINIKHIRHNAFKEAARSD